MRKSLWNRIISAALAFALVTMFAPPPMVASADTLTYVGMSQGDAGGNGTYVANDNTPYAVHMGVGLGTPLSPSAVYAYSICATTAAVSTTPTPAPGSDLGYTWNGTTNQWVQADNWSQCPTVTTDGSGQLGSGASTWAYGKIADENLAAGTNLTLVLAFRQVTSLSPLTFSNTVYYSAGTGFAPTVTVQSISGSGLNALAWAHASTYCGKPAPTRISTILPPFSLSAHTGLELVRTSSNPAVAADFPDANGVVNDVYGDGTGDFRMAVPANTGVVFVTSSSNNGSLSAPYGNGSSTGTTFTMGPIDSEVCAGAADMTPPTAPGALTATYSVGSVALSWGAASDDSAVTGYYVYRWQDPTVTTMTPWPALTTSAPVRVATVTVGTTYTDSSVGSGTYHYLVRAYDAATNIGPRTNSVTAYPGDVAAPVTTISGVPTSGGHTASPATFTLAATDDVSGVASTYYTVDAGSTTTYTVPVAVTGTGSHTVTYWSVDNAGNIEGTHTATFFISAGPPVTAISGNQSGWWNANETITLTPSGDSPSFTTFYALNGGAVTTYTTPVVLSTEGTTTFTYFSTDAAGQTESTKSATILIDKSKPVTTLGGVVNHGVYASPATFTLSGFDAYSGIDGSSPHYVLDSVQPTVTYTTPVVVSTPGVHTLAYWSKDLAGNGGNKENTNVVTFTVSAGPPVTGISGNTVGWSLVNETITLTPVGDAGPFTTFYSLNGGATTTYTVPFAVSTEGTDTLTYYSVDSAGQTEGTKSATLLIDKTKPVTTLGGVADGHAYSSPATFTLSGTDNASGIDGSSPHYVLDSVQPTVTYTTPVVVSTPGTHTLSYWSKDVAGNKENTHNATFTISAGPPVTTLSGNTVGWSTVPETLTLTPAGDAGPFTSFYTLNGGAATTYTAPFVVSAQGTTTVGYYSKDAASQTEAAHTATIQVDSVAPVTSLAGVPASHISSVPVTLTESALELTSGLANSFYNADGSGLTTYTAPFVVSGIGAHSVSYYSVDVAGNVESASTATFSISSGPPTTTISGNTVGWSTATETITLTPSGDSGPFQTFYAINGGASTAYSVPFAISTQGTTTLTWASVDSLGQVETTKSATILFDKTVPVTTLAGVANGGVYTSPATFTLSGTDNASGIDGQSPHYVLDSVQPTVTYTTPVVVSTPGTHTLSYWSKDVAGNKESTHNATFTVSAGPPVTTLSGNTIGWSTVPETLTLTPAGDAGPFTSFYALNGGASATYTVPFAISAQGTTTVAYHSVDSLSQSEVSKNATIQVDSVAPTSTLAGVANGGYYSTAATFTLSATDAASGVNHIFYLLDSNPTTVTYTTATPVSGVGSHTVKYWATDVAGNKEATHTATFSIFSGAPVTTPSPTATGSFNNAQVFSLTATEPSGPGVANTFYRLDGGAVTTYSVGLGVVPIFSTVGNHTLTYYSTDTLGNVEASHVGTFAIADTLAPITITDDATTYSDVATITLTASDIQFLGLGYGVSATGSGVAATHWSVNGGSTWTTGTQVVVSQASTSTYTLLYYSVDNAGNTEATGSAAFHVNDTIDPITSTDATSSYVGTATIHLTAHDNTGGLGVAATYYSLDGAGFTQGTSVTTTATGSHTLLYYSVDKASPANSESPKEVDFSVTPFDTTPPISSSDATASYIVTATVHLSATDNAGGIGVGTLYYKLDGGSSVTTVAAVGSPTTLTAPVVMTGIGAHSIEFWSADKLGNTESPHHTVNFTINKGPASITISAVPTSVKLPKPFVLSGVLTIPANGLPCIVYVKKPGSSRWSYSSARLTYNAGVAPATADGTNWWYRYTPKLRGTYSFYVNFAGDATHLAATSPTIKVTVK